VLKNRRLRKVYDEEGKEGLEAIDNDGGLPNGTDDDDDDELSDDDSDDNDDSDDDGHAVSRREGSTTTRLLRGMRIWRTDIGWLRGRVGWKVRTSVLPTSYLPSTVCRQAADSYGRFVQEPPPSVSAFFCGAPASDASSRSTPLGGDARTGTPSASAPAPPPAGHSHSARWSRDGARTSERASEPVKPITQRTGL